MEKPYYAVWECESSLELFNIQLSIVGHKKKVAENPTVHREAKECVDAYKLQSRKEIKLLFNLLVLKVLMFKGLILKF